MSAAEFAALSPHVAIAAGAVLAMLLAPLRGHGPARTAAGAGLLAAAFLLLDRAGAPATAVGELLADDGMARFGAAVAVLTSLAALVFLRPEGRGREAPALVALVALGAATLSGARHGATLFLGLELVSLSLVALFAFPLGRRNLEASYKYLMTSGLASAALLLGVALLYGETGALGFAGWRGGGPFFAFGSALLLAGLAFKFALAPFHMWSPDAFEGAPATAATLAGAVSKAGVAVALVRLAAEAAPAEPLWTTGLAWLAGASILAGNLLALNQPSLPRMLGYSSIAHSGYLAAILASGSDRAPEAALFTIAAYAPALVAALCGGALVGDAPTLESLRGLARRRPVEAGAFALGLLSLAGLPVAAGFIAKLLLFLTLAEGERWTLLAVAAAGSGMGFYFYARFMAAPFREGNAAGAAARGGVDRWTLAAAAGLVLLFGALPQTLLGALSDAPAPLAP